MSSSFLNRPGSGTGDGLSPESAFVVARGLRGAFGALGYFEGLSFFSAGSFLIDFFLAGPFFFLGLSSSESYE